MVKKIVTGKPASFIYLLIYTFLMLHIATHEHHEHVHDVKSCHFCIFITYNNDIRLVEQLSLSPSEHVAYIKHSEKNILFSMEFQGFSCRAPPGRFI